MQIRQIQVARDALQDRLTLRISSQADEEFRVWLTRRFLRELWPHLTALLSGHLAPRPQAATETTTSPAATEPQASFDKPFQEDKATYPLGMSPLLASEVKLSPVSDGIVQITFREGWERSFNLSLNAEMLQALCAMLRNTAKQSAWDLVLDYDKSALAQTEPPAPIPVKSGTLLH